MKHLFSKLLFILSNYLSLIFFGVCLSIQSFGQVISSSGATPAPGATSIYTMIDASGAQSQVCWSSGDPLYWSVTPSNLASISQFPSDGSYNCQVNWSSNIPAGTTATISFNGQIKNASGTCIWVSYTLNVNVPENGGGDGTTTWWSQYAACNPSPPGNWQVCGDQTTIIGQQPLPLLGWIIGILGQNDCYVNFYWQSSSSSGGPFGDIPNYSYSIKGNSDDQYVTYPIPTPTQCGVTYYRMRATYYENSFLGACAGVPDGSAFTNVVRFEAVPPKASIITNVNSFCPGGSATLQANAGSGISYQWYNNGSPISSATSSSYTTTVTGSYSVIETSSGGCSATSNTISITANTSPAATITASGNTTFCSGGNVALNANTGTGYTYQWYNNGSAISGATGSSYTANSSGSYTVTVTTSSKCSATSSATSVTVNPLPPATITASGNTTFCAGGNVALNVNTGTGYTYQWNNNGSAISGAIGSSYTANSSGSYTVVVTNSSNCSVTSPATSVTVNSLPSATITASGSTTFCTGGNVVLNASTGSGYTYQWYNNGSAISAATGSSYTANSSGSYTVTVTTSSNCSATSAATSVTVNPLPLAIITVMGPATTICADQSVTFDANTGTGLSYKWNNNGSAISGATGSSYTTNSAGTYTLVVTNSNNCSATSDDGYIVKINPLPPATITASGNTTFCAGGNVALNANTGTGLTYQWNNSSGAISGATNASYTAATADNYTVKVTNSSGCFATSSATSVTVNTTPSATISAASSTTFCSGNSVTLNANTGSDLAYQWYLNNSAISGAITSAYTASAVGNYTVMVTSTASPSCGTGVTSSATTVTLNPLPPVPPFTLSATSICPLGTTIANVQTNSSYTSSWSLPAGATVLGGGGGPTGFGETIQLINAGNNVFSLTYTNPTTGCTNTSTQTVVVNPDPAPVITALSSTTFCQGGSVVLTANSGTGLSYQWYLNSSPISGATGLSYTATAAGQYILQEISSSGCLGISHYSSIVTVNPLPSVPVFTLSPSIICQNATIGASVTTPPSGYTYTWNIPTGATTVGGSGTSTGFGEGIKLTSVGTNVFSLTYTNSSTGCTNTITQSVLVNSLPSATITAASSTTFCTGGSVVLNANSGTGLNYQWYLNSTAISGATGVSYTATVSGNYTVQVSSSAATACASAVTSVATTVTVNPLPPVPVFTLSPSIICQNATVGASVTTPSGYTYSWSLPAGATVLGGAGSSTGFGESIKLTSAGTNVFSLTYTNSSTGCTNTTTESVLVNSLPSATITAASSTTFCAGGSVVLNANSGTGLTYQWYLNATAISGATGVSYTATASGNYTVQVSSSATTACAAAITSAATTVTVNPLPSVPVFTLSPAIICQNATLGASVTTPSSGYTYTWNLPAGGTSIAGGGTPTGFGEDIRLTSVGTNVFSLTYTNSSTGCTNTTTESVLVNSLPSATIAAASSTSLCTGGSVVLNANSGTGLNYQWYLNSTAISGATAVSYTATASGNYTVQVSSSAATACAAAVTSTPTTVTVFPYTRASITVSPATTVCAGTTIGIGGSYLSNSLTLITVPSMTNMNDGFGPNGFSYSGIISASGNVVLTNTTPSSSCTYTTTVAITVVPASISTSPLSSTSYVVGGSVTVPFTVCSSENPDNVFTAQLSDASGNFASPVSIGTVSGTSSGSISATIPSATAAGTGYRIRVVSLGPAYIGTDNGTNLSITTGSPRLAFPYTSSGNLDSNQVVIYPNPTTGVVNIDFNYAQSAAVDIHVFDVLGNEAYTQSLGAQQTGKTTVDLSAKPSGLYVVQVTSGSSVTTQKVILAK